MKRLIAILFAALQPAFGQEYVIGTSTNYGVISQSALPASVWTNTLLWWSASTDGTNVTQSSNYIDFAYNKTGEIWQETEARQPTLIETNGLRGYDFDASDDRIALGVRTNATTNVTFYCKFTYTGNGPLINVPSGITIFNSSSIRYLPTNTTPNLAAFGVPTMTNGLTYRVGISQKGPLIDLYFGGNYIRSVTNTITNVGFSANSYIGQAVASYSPNIIHEVAVFDRPLSEEEWSEIK